MSETLLVQMVPGVWGGRYRMTPGSRIPAFMVAWYLQESDLDSLHDGYPRLSDAQIGAVREWLEASPEEVEQERARFESDAIEARDALPAPPEPA